LQGIAGLGNHFEPGNPPGTLRIERPATMFLRQIGVFTGLGAGRFDRGSIHRNSVVLPAPAKPYVRE